MGLSGFCLLERERPAPSRKGMRSDGMGAGRNPYKTHTGMKKQGISKPCKKHQDITANRAHDLGRKRFGTTRDINKQQGITSPWVLVRMRSQYHSLKDMKQEPLPHGGTF